MAIRHRPPSPHALIFNPKDEPSLTEQEHKDSCDAAKMVKRAALGQPILTNSNQRYGHDDVNIDLTQHLINKQQVEENLQRISSQEEFSEEDMKHIPPSIKKKFKLKQKASQPVPPKNDDKTTNKGEPAPDASTKS